MVSKILNIMREMAVTYSLLGKLFVIVRGAGKLFMGTPQSLNSAAQSTNTF